MTPRRVRVLLAVASAIGLAVILQGRVPEANERRPQQATAGTPQSGVPQGPPPAAAAPGPGAVGQIFRTQTELVRVDVNVVDRDGRPQSGLSAADFQVTVDGRPRRLVSADFVDLQPIVKREAASGGTGDQPMTVTWSSNEGVSAAGRLYALVVDQANIQPGGVRAAGEAARRFVSRLTPTDRVALFTIPSGVAVDFSTDHARVLNALLGVSGSAQRLEGVWANISVTEAISLQNIGADVCSSALRMTEEPLNSILVRNRCFFDEVALRENCCRQVMAEAGRVANGVQLATRESLMALETLLNRLAGIEGPKTIILLTQRLVTGGIGRLEFSTDLKRLGLAAANAHIALYVLHLSRAFVDAVDAESGVRSETGFADEAVTREGLETLAGYARGALVRVVAGADFAFDRIVRETSAYYLLGFEPLAEERDGKPHQIRVRVQRRGTEVRARAEFVIAPTANLDPRQRLLAVLRTPGATKLLQMRVATRVLPGGRSDLLQIVLAADIGREASSQNVMVGYVVTDEAGRNVTGGGETRLLEPGEGVWGDLSLRYAGIIDLPPGRYRLKVAAVDESGTSGSVEHQFEARLTEAGPLVIGDLILASATAGKLAAGIAVDDTVAGGRARAYVQMRPRQDVKGNLEVTAEVADTPTGRALLTTALPVGPTKEGLIIADGPMDLRLLPPGNYYGRVAVTLDGRRLASRSTPLRLVSAVSGSEASGADTAGSHAAGAATLPPASSAAAASASPGARLAIGADRLLVRSFDRRDVLRPDVAAYFVDRLATASPGAVASVTEARQAARTANFSALAERLPEVNEASLDGAFLRGLERYASGDAKAAAKEFRAAVTLNSEFLPAIFYLGACYASGGNDREAVGAWQAALTNETDARIVYEVLVDALLRLNEVPKAREILEEARGRWQGEAALVPRAAAVAAADHDAKGALGLLEPYLASYPADADALFLALRLLYQASADGKPLGTRQDDGEKLVKYAKQYEAANGPERAIVQRWLAFVQSRQ